MCEWASKLRIPCFLVLTCVLTSFYFSQRQERPKDHAAPVVPCCEVKQSPVVFFFRSPLTPRQRSYSRIQHKLKWEREREDENREGKICRVHKCQGISNVPWHLWSIAHLWFGKCNVSFLLQRETGPTAGDHLFPADTVTCQCKCPACVSQWEAVRERQVKQVYTNNYRLLKRSSDGDVSEKRGTFIPSLQLLAQSREERGRTSFACAFWDVKNDLWIKWCMHSAPKVAGCSVFATIGKCGDNGKRISWPAR